MRNAISAVILSLALVTASMMSFGFTELSNDSDTQYTHDGNNSTVGNHSGPVMTYGNETLSLHISLIDEDMMATPYSCNGGVALFELGAHMALTEENSTEDPDDYIVWGGNLTGGSGYHNFTNAPQGDYYLGAHMDCEDAEGIWTFYYGSPENSDGDLEEITFDGTSGVSVYMELHIDNHDWESHDFVCGDGTTIPFEDVNDGVVDCPLGADEQQFYDSDICWNTHNGQEYMITDAGNASEECESFTIHPVFDSEGNYSHGECVNDFTGVTISWNEEDCEATWFEVGDKLNWFDCHDGHQVWIDQVNNGIEDCLDGEDEGHSMGNMYEDIHIWEDIVNETASGAHWDVTIGIDAFDLAPGINYSVGIDVWADQNLTASDDLAIMPEDVSVGYANMWWTVELEDGCYWVTVDLVDVDEGTTLAEDYMDLEVGEAHCGDDDDDHDIEDAFMEIDSYGNNDAFVTLNEIIDYINYIEASEGNDPLSSEDEEWLEGAFNESDYDGDGALDLDEFEYFTGIIDDEGPLFICGDGSEIPFSWVNDGEQDCADGADEQQYNTDGAEINWFDCHDGSQVWIHQVNDGNEDCADGEDEGHNDDHDDDHSEDPYCYDMENHLVVDVDKEECEASGYWWETNDYDAEAEWEGLFWLMDTDNSSTLDINEMLVFFNPSDDTDASTVFEIMLMMHDYDESSDLDLEEFIAMMYTMEDDDDDDHGHDFCYDMENHLEVDIDNQADCEAAGHAWSTSEDDHDDDMDMDCNDWYMEMHIEVYEMGGVHFYFDQYCEMTEEDSDAYRKQLDSMFGNGDGVLNAAEVALIESMMNMGDDDREPMMVCYDMDTHEMDFSMSKEECEAAGLMWVSEDSGPDGGEDRDDHDDHDDHDDRDDHDDHGDSMNDDDHGDNDDRDDYDTWTINGVEVELHSEENGEMFQNLAGPGPIYMTQHSYSDFVDLKDGETTIVITYVNSEVEDDDHDHGDDHGDDHADGNDRCFEVRIISKDDWMATAASIDSTAWEQIDDSEDGEFVYKGCEDPREFSATYEYQGIGHPNGVENMPPVCDFWWFYHNDTAFEEGSKLEVTPTGDVELQLDAGKYWISVWCIDAEGDEITVKWEAPLFNLTNEFHGIGEAHGYVEFTIPAGISEVLEVPYKWHSEEWEGNGTFLISIDSGEGDGDEIEGDGDGLPGFTGLMAVTALLGAVLFLGRRD